MSGADAGNYVLDSVASTTANITAKHITGKFTADNKEYDGNNSATVLTRSLVDAITGDAVSLIGGTATFSDKNVGNGKTVTLIGAILSGTDAPNYVLDSVASTTANIAAKHITGSFTTDNKVYDGNNGAAVLTRSLNDVISPDVVTLIGGTATFSDKNVGTGKTVTLAGATLSGAAAANYFIDSVETTTANITALHITGTFKADNKVYDGNNSATVLTRSLVDAITGDAVSLTGGTATFSDQNVGTGKTVTLTGAGLSGTDAPNYVLDSVATTTANITAKHITGSFTADNKVYDGNNTATVLTRSLIGVISPDVVTLIGGTATFSSKNVGMGKTVTLTGATLSGADVGNYLLESVAPTTANITALHITGTFTADNKTYDGNASAVVLTRSLVGTISGDLVSLTGGTASFNDKNVGMAKTVTLTAATLGGTDAGNYALDSVVTTTANIIALHITGTFTADNKVYDGSTSATVLTRLLVGAVSADAVNLSGGTANFSDKNAGNGKTVTLVGASLTGTDAGNYVLDSVATTAANITKATATVVVTPYNVVYDLAPHTAKITSIAGVPGETGSTVGTVDVSNTTHINPGSYTSDYWFFTGTANYNNIGNTTITDTISFGTCAGSGVILQPINADGSSVFPKSGRTVPVKFTVCDAFGNPISNPNAVFAGTGGQLTMLSAVRGQLQTVDESAYNDIPDAAFRYSGGQWIFNMGTSNLVSGNTYTFRINLAYAPSSITFKIAIK